MTWNEVLEEGFVEYEGVLMEEEEEESDFVSAVRKSFLSIG